MLRDLLRREEEGRPVRVALLGCGAMGTGIAWQLRRTPGMRLVVAADRDPAARAAAARAWGGPAAPWQEARSRSDTLALAEGTEWLEDGAPACDVLVEATNTVGFAARACLQAIEAGLHVVLMNAEVDLALGPLLQQAAAARGVVVTSDAGDQHGVLARMIEEVRLWGFRIAMAGNIKGYLDRYATARGLVEEARKRRLNPVQCCAYTDGTKLSVEMALVANGTGLRPWVPGMEGPRAAHVREVFDRFDFERYGVADGQAGVVDYLLGAEPGGGVFVVGWCDDPLQRFYLDYYKVHSRGPWHLFYRPYHLCHLETPRAIALAALWGKAVLRPEHGRVADVYAWAKTDLPAGTVIAHGIGGDACYGVIESAGQADARGAVPIALLETAPGEAAPVLRRPVRRDAPLTWEDLELPDSEVLRLYRRQQGGAPQA